MRSQEVLGLTDSDYLQGMFHEDFIAQLQWQEAGTYSTQLPWKPDHPTLPSNKNLTLARLQSSSCKLGRIQKIEEYHTVVEQQLEQGILEVRFWYFYGAKTKAPKIPKEVKLGNLKASTPKAKADLFNRFVASVFLKSSSMPRNTSITGNKGNELYSIQASIDEVTKALRAIDPNKAYGPDQIPGRLLKECASESVPSPTQLINLSLRTGQVPKEWKRANIVPIFKKGRKRWCEKLQADLSTEPPFKDGWMLCDKSNFWVYC